MLKEATMPSTVPGPWVEAWLSQPRFNRYLAECGGDRQRALSTYEWNLSLGHALMRDAAHFEIALRNAYDRAITARWQGTTHWLTDPSSPVQVPLWRTIRGRLLDVNAPNRTSIADAVRKAGGQQATPTADAVVTQLTFGFWEHLSDAVHEQSIWIPLVYYAWPKGTSRSRVDQAIHLIGTIRNRAAHNEPVFPARGAQSPLNVHATTMGLLTMLDSDLASYVQRTSTVAAAWAARP